MLRSGEVSPHRPFVCLVSKGQRQDRRNGGLGVSPERASFASLSMTQRLGKWTADKWVIPQLCRKSGRRELAEPLILGAIAPRIEERREGFSVVSIMLPAHSACLCLCRCPV